jgi:DNA polymerase IIIc chi subunit
MEINFYQLENLDCKVIAQILLKIKEEKKRTLIYAKTDEILKQIDEVLWSFSKTKFLPHATKWEKVNPLEQPTFLTNEENNQNQAEFLLMLDEVSDDFLKKFEKIFYFFNNSNLESARKLYSNYKKKSFSINFYKKDGDKWIKAA